MDAFASLPSKDTAHQRPPPPQRPPPLVPLPPLATDGAANEAAFGAAATANDPQPNQRPPLSKAGDTLPIPDCTNDSARSPQTLSSPPPTTTNTHPLAKSSQKSRQRNVTRCVIVRAACPQYTQLSYSDNCQPTHSQNPRRTRPLSESPHSQRHCAFAGSRLVRTSLHSNPVGPVHRDLQNGPLAPCSPHVSVTTPAIVRLRSLPSLYRVSLPFSAVSCQQTWLKPVRCAAVLNQSALAAQCSYIQPLTRCVVRHSICNVQRHKYGCARPHGPYALRVEVVAAYTRRVHPAVAQGPTTRASR